MSELVNYQDEVPVQRSLACQGYRQHPALFRPGVCNADRVAGRGHAGRRQIAMQPQLQCKGVFVQQAVAGRLVRQQPAIVLGCSQRERLTELATQAPQVPALVRASGGGAVLTGPWMVSASVALPLTHPWVRGRLPDSYRELGQLHVDALAALGVAGRALPESEVAAANAHLGPVVGWAAAQLLVGSCAR